MNVSVVIPAYNAARTLAETLDSLLLQTHRGWEAIVVDDRSTDETTALASRYAASDARIRVVRREENGGEAGARNTGVGEARHDWLLFLDSDDWIEPAHLERMTAALAADPGLDAVHCGWIRVMPDGRRGDVLRCASSSEEMFATSARHCPFAIHACVVRREVVESVGGFDASLRTCPDWDLWQRVARAGAEFSAIDEPLARYRVRPDSASMDGRQILADGLRVIARGHAPDPRVARPHPAMADGMPACGLSEARFFLACWTGGLALGHGDDARPLLDQIGDDIETALRPELVAGSLFATVPLPSGRTGDSWVEIWPVVAGRLEAFLVALEARSLTPGLSARARRDLEYLILARAADRLPLTIGATHARRVDITQPIPHLAPDDAAARRLVAFVEMGGESLGTVELPVFDGDVPAPVLADAIAAELAWPILGRYLAQTVYRGLRVFGDNHGHSIHRGGVSLAQGVDGAAPSADDPASWSRAHDSIGWTVLLQELWGRPDWPEAKFYDAGPRPGTPGPGAGPWPVVEVGHEPGDGQRIERRGRVVPTIGGVPLGVTAASAARATILEEAGMELAIAAVREGILGMQPTDAPTSLRERLAARPRAELVAGPAGRRSLVSGAARRMVAGDECGLLVGRGRSQPIGSPPSRRAVLPSEFAALLIEDAEASGDDVLRPGTNCGPAPRIACGPDPIDCGPSSTATPGRSWGRAVRDRASALFHRDPSAAGGGSAPPPSAETAQLPILMYHRVAPDGAANTARYRASPEAFEAHLRILRDGGYRSVGLEEWRAAKSRRTPLPGRCVTLTFDDGCLDFLTYAWPLLDRYGFSAIVFLVADEIGGTNRWDRAHGEEVPLLDWAQIRHLRDQGIEFGSHTATHRILDSLPPEEVVREGLRSRSILERGLGRPVRSIAYPHGGEDRVVRHLIGACGYNFGLRCKGGHSRFPDPLLGLPRIEVPGATGPEDFLAKLDVPGRRVEGPAAH